MAGRRSGRCVRSLCVGALLASAGAATARADGPSPGAASAAAVAPDPFHELESKYLFGFTEGSDIGEQGEQSVEFENSGAFGKRGGRYGAIEQEIEYESVPSQYLGYELSAHGLAHDIRGVDGFGDLSGVNFSGLSAEFRYLVIGRGPGSPIGLTLIAEPEWARIDGETGAPTTDFSTTFRIAADTELLPNRLFAAINLVYAPDIGRISGADWARSSQFGATGALAWRVTPKTTIGGEVEYYRDYDSFAFQAFAGDAVYVGPTLNIQFNSKVMLAAAFSADVAGAAAGSSRRLDLVDFERYHTNLKLEFEF